jgi:group II intron reverse transcriptase/maturase
MYVASGSDKEWLLSVQRKLYTRSWENPDYVFRKLWGFVTDSRNLRCSLARINRNKGRRTAGVDGVTVRMILAEGVEDFIDGLRGALRSGEYRPSPAKRRLIPKAGKPGEFRPLGIPTVKDRVVQAAVKNIMEPIFEADFYPSSFGFRPGKSVHGALEHLRLMMSGHALRVSPKEEPRLPYQGAVEGDIKGCFDNISHHGLMNRVRRRIGDGKLNRLVVAFLKAGVMSEKQFLRTKAGTPQGGILSPLLANIALSVIDERYERFAWPRFKPARRDDEASIKRRARQHRQCDKSQGKPVLVPIRYADDFIILVHAPKGENQMELAHELAEQEKAALAKLLKDELNLELSGTKTLVTPMTASIRFLGYHFKVQRHPVWGWVTKIVIPKTSSKRLREQIKIVFRRPICNQSLERRLKELNPIIRGWGYFYRYAWGGKNVFNELDHHIWHSIFRWLRKKHPHRGLKQLAKRYSRRKPGRRSIDWRDGSFSTFKLSSISVGRYRLAGESRPDFVATSRETPVHSERCTPGSVEGAPKTAR